VIFGLQFWPLDVGNLGFLNFFFWSQRQMHEVKNDSGSHSFDF